MQILFICSGNGSQTPFPINQAPIRPPRSRSTIYNPTMANLLFLFMSLVAFITMSVSAPDGFVNIDCGATVSFTDSNLLVWEADEAVTGQSQTVQNPTSVSQELRTLRVFSGSRKKNCYSISVQEGVKKVLVRAAFHYGNYDKKSSPPTFDLHLDGNNWATVTTLLDQPVTHEAIYVPKGGSTSLCVAQTKPNQLPFISSVEARALDDGMYNDIDANHALFLVGRYAYGATDIVRYSDDAYDRIWRPAAAGLQLTAVTSTAPSIDTSIADNPPKAVLQTAITINPAYFGDSILLSPRSTLPTTAVPVYANLYFSEVAELDFTQKRSINVFLNNKIPMNLQPVVPVYGGVVEITLYNITADASSNLTLVPASDSTLLPIINALELFTVSDVLSDGTNSDDVAALGALQQQFKKLQEWSGDPCLPATLNWEWVACSSDPTPRITALLLSGLQLKGPLPDFSAMDALQTIDMRNNNINGEIPDFLGSLPNLKQLNLANNDFSGRVPSSISQDNKIKLDVSGNPNLCTSGKTCTLSAADPGTGTSDGASTLPSSGNRKKNTLPLLLGILIPCFSVFSAIVGFVVFKCRQRKPAGQMNTPNKPGHTAATAMAMPGSTAQVHNANIGQSPIGAHQHLQQAAAANDSVIDISNQMASELHNLFQQQEQATDHQDNNRQ